MNAKIVLHGKDTFFKTFGKTKFQTYLKNEHPFSFNEYTFWWDKERDEYYITKLVDGKPENTFFLDYDSYYVEVQVVLSLGEQQP